MQPPGISDSLAGRFSFQVINHAGYARDVYHNVDLENLDSVQFRGQLLYAPKDDDFRASLIVDYSRDSGDGINRVGIPDPVLTGTRPWSTARAQIAALRPGGLSVRESLPVWPLFAGDASPSPQYVRHKNASYILKLEKDVATDIRLTSITGYRDGRAYTLYDQTGLGPTNPYNVITTLLFAEPVNFIEEDHQFSQEFRLTSNYADSRFDWILGAYYLHNKVHQFNRFWGETPFQPGGRAPGALAVLSGESHWDDHGTNEDIAGFAQLGFKLTPTLKVEAGIRYTHDKKGGTQVGIATATGDRFVPTDPTPLTPLAVVPGFSTAYGKTWSRATPQVTATWKPQDGISGLRDDFDRLQGRRFPERCAERLCRADAVRSRNRHQLRSRHQDRILGPQGACQPDRVLYEVQESAGSADQRRLPVQHHQQRLVGQHQGAGG